MEPVPVFSKSLRQENPIELVMNEAGKAVLLHKGKLAHPCLWIQYDSIGNHIQLITPDGSIQEFGLVVPEAAKPHLKKMRAIDLIEVNPDMSCGACTLIIFNNVLH